MKETIRNKHTSKLLHKYTDNHKAWQIPLQNLELQIITETQIPAKCKSKEHIIYVKKKNKLS